MNLFIQTTEELTRFCSTLKEGDFVSIDTEFMRERTYWSKLCLVQLAGPFEAVLVDPLAEGIDLTPLFDLMANKGVLKVFHAARQDVEIFVNLTGKVPTPIADTQVAAMVCGFGDSASYETLVDKLAGVKIDKSSRFTDWSQRPLTERQLDYALADVTHLRVVYENLKKQLENTGRWEWLHEEMEILEKVGTYEVDPNEIWRRLKLRSDKPRLCAMAQAIAAWREREAQKANVPRGRIMKDDTMLEIIHHAPVSAAELSRTRGLSQGYAESRQGMGLLVAIEKARALSQEECPKAKARPILPHGANAVLDLLRVLLKQVVEEERVAAKLIATSDNLEALVCPNAEDSPVMKGWRRQLFGEKALALKEGKLALKMDKGKVVVFNI